MVNSYFSAKLDGVKTYMRMRRVPNHLQVKVIKWFDYLWLTQKCSDEEKAVSCLPDKLKVTPIYKYILTCVNNKPITALLHPTNVFTINLSFCHISGWNSDKRPLRYAETCWNFPKHRSWLLMRTGASIATRSFLSWRLHMSER